MSLYIETEGNIEFPFDVRETAEMVVDAALKYVACPYEAEVSLLITHDEEIHEMNNLRSPVIFRGSTKRCRMYLIRRQGS